MADTDVATNNLPDSLALLSLGAEVEMLLRRTAASFVVPMAEIEATLGWDLSLNCYK